MSSEQGVPVPSRPTRPVVCPPPPPQQAEQAPSVLPTPVHVAPSLTVLPSELPSELPSDSGLGLPTGPQPGPSAERPSPAAAAGPTGPARSALVMAAGTVLSRVSGFARLLAVAWVLGQGRLADAFNQANTVPNQVYDLLLGGVLSATLLPVLMQSLSRRASPEDDDAVPAVVSFLTVALVAATVVFWLAAPLIVRLFLLDARGADVGAERALATSWLRLFAPQLLFMGLITVTTALLNARRRFASVAFSPVLANLVAIGALVVADHMVRPSSIDGYRQDAAAVAVIGIGTTAGYLVQLIAQLPALVRARVPLRPRWAPGHPALRAIGRLSGWTLGAVAANQVSYALVAVLAQNKRGDFSAFSYAYAFMLLPYAVVAVSIAYAVAPDLAERWSRGNSAAFGAQFARAARVTIVLLLPGGVGYALVARPTVVVALAHGHLSGASADLTGTLLAIFALGLPGFSTYLLVMRAFQAKQDTRSMFWLYVLENGLTVVGALILYPVIGIRGLAVAWIGSYTVTLPVAWLRLRQSTSFAFPFTWVVKTATSTGVMAGSVTLVLSLVQPTGSLALGVGRLVLAVAVGLGVFVATARWFGIEELRQLPERWRALSAPPGAARLPGGANEA